MLPQWNWNGFTVFSRWFYRNILLWTKYWNHIQTVKIWKSGRWSDKKSTVPFHQSEDEKKCAWYIWI